MNCTAGVVLITKGTALPVDAEDGEKVMSVVRPTLFKIGTSATQLERSCPICTPTHTQRHIQYLWLLLEWGLIPILYIMTVGAEWPAHHTA